MSSGIAAAFVFPPPPPIPPMQGPSRRLLLVTKVVPTLPPVQVYTRIKSKLAPISRTEEPATRKTTRAPKFSYAPVIHEHQSLPSCCAANVLCQPVSCCPEYDVAKHARNQLSLQVGSTATHDARKSTMPRANFTLLLRSRLHCFTQAFHRKDISKGETQADLPVKMCTS